MAVDLAVRDWGPARAGGRRAPPAHRQPADGLPALAVRRLLPGRGRRRGPLHALLLATAQRSTKDVTLPTREQRIESYKLALIVAEV